MTAYSFLFDVLRQFANSNLAVPTTSMRRMRRAIFLPITPSKSATPEGLRRA